MPCNRAVLKETIGDARVSDRNGMRRWQVGGEWGGDVAIAETPRGDAIPGRRFTVESVRPRAGQSLRRAGGRMQRVGY